MRLVNIQVPVLQQSRGLAYRQTTLGTENIHEEEDNAYSNAYVQKPKVAAQ